MTKHDKQVMFFVQECLNDEKLHHLTLGALARLIDHVDTIIKSEFPEDITNMTEEQIRAKYTL